MDLVRQLLLEIEGYPDGPHRMPPMTGYSADLVAYHLKLLAQAGLIEVHDSTTIGSRELLPKCLTWQGHEFLDAARDETIWRKAKQRITAATGTVSLAVLQDLLKQVAGQALGLP